MIVIGFDGKIQQVFPLSRFLVECFVNGKGMFIIFFFQEKAGQSFPDIILLRMQVSEVFFQGLNDS